MSITLSGQNSTVVILTWYLVPADTRIPMGKETMQRFSSRSPFSKEEKKKTKPNRIQRCPQGLAGLKNVLEGEGGIFVANFRPSSCFCSLLTLCPLQSCVFWESARSQVVFSFFTLSHKESFITCGLKLAANCKEMSQRLQLFLCPGSWDACQGLCQRGLFSDDCQRKEARSKEERKEIAQGWGHALHLFFLLICSFCTHPGFPQLAKLLRAAGAFTPVCSSSQWSVVQPLAEHIERNWLSLTSTSR